MEKEKVVTFRIDYSLLSDMQRIAKEEQVSTSRLIRAALRKFTEEYENKESTPAGDCEASSDPC